MSAIVSCLGVTQTECGCSSNSLCVCTACKIAIYNSNSIPCKTALAISDVTLVNNHHDFKSSKHKLYQRLIYSVNIIPSVNVAKPLLYFLVSISYSKSFAAQLIRILT